MNIYKQMTLTGKSREQFLNIFGVDKLVALQQFYNKTDVEQNALIVDFFDSKGIYINIKSKFGQRKQCERFAYHVRHFNSGFIFNSRQEATIEAIKSANGVNNKI